MPESRSQAARPSLLRVLLLVLALPSGCARPRVEPVSCGRLVVATWNVRRLFDSRCDSGHCGDREAEGIATPEEVDADVMRIGAAARELDADVVVLEEVENDALLARVAEAHGGLLYRAMGDSPGEGTIDVGVLSRVPIVDVRHHAHATITRPDGRRTRPTRDLVEVTLALAPRPVIVYAAHFKSQRNDDPGRRYGEADLAGRLITARARSDEALFVLAGDLNDIPGSPPLAHLEKDFGLFRATSLLAPGDAYTIAYGGRTELVDHVYVRSIERGDVRGVEVVRGAGVGYAGSDHAAIRTAFVWGDDGGTAETCVPLGSSADLGVARSTGSP